MDGGWGEWRQLSISFFYSFNPHCMHCAPFSMLSESFVASTLSSAKTPTATLRDVGICVQEFQPSPQLRSTFKKSSTTTNCLAVTPSHIFSAQADKAVVHVYSREKGNQEGLVPFPERIRSIAVAGAKYGDVLVLGTEGGRLILWEV
jgi:pre-rRNA-processing protein IPI3